MSSKKYASSVETANRIRSAAIAEIGARGFGKTTVRKIAERADVSPGLVIHHFGSKEGLRDACDDFVFNELTEIKRGHVSSIEAVGVMFADPTVRTYIDYIGVSLMDSSAQGQRYFDHYVDVVEQVIEEGFAGYSFRKGEDRRAQAAMIAMVGLSPTLLETRIRHVLGTEDFAGTMERLAPYLYDLYMHGFIEPEATAD